MQPETCNRSIENPAAKNHPFMDRWLTNGANSFLELNLWAEDLRVLENVPDVGTVVDDLRNAARCLPARHVLHTAALFERRVKGTVAKFFQQTDKR